MKNYIKIISVIISVAMIISSMALTTFAIEDVADISVQPEKAEASVNTTVSDNTSVIENANALANGVQNYYKDFTLREYYVENQNMSFEYMLQSTTDQQLANIKNTQGESYIENTFDTFVKLTNGEIFYSSGSSLNASVNVFRYGYYYDEVRFEGQNFTNGIKAIKEGNITLQAVGTPSDSTVSSSSNGLTVTITDPYDPYFSFPEVAYSAEEYKYLVLEMKTTSENASSAFYVTMSGDDKLSHSQHVDFALIPDGEYHTYEIYLGNIDGYTGTVKNIRIDFNNTSTGDVFEIKSLKIVSAEDSGVSKLSAARIFHTYSDKLHHELQVVAQETTSNIAEIGLITKIAKETVDKIIIKDKNGTHSTLDGVDWKSAEYVGFDIKEAGIFGYILPVHETTGKMVVTLDGDNYVITQSRAPKNNTIVAGDASTGNINDFYMGQRLYTDENHDFDAFITEAEIERNPLDSSNIKVNNNYSEESACFAGYDAIRGSYDFYLPGTDFNTAYYAYTNRHYGINFTVTGDNYNRNIYVNAATNVGALESAAILDKNLMMLPIPVEVAKNFGTDGDNTLYDILDTAYGEAIFPISVTKNETFEYNVMHLYQNWGKYPLKQISSIEFHSPYYHLSTGVTETNCISIFAGSTANLLPDHRGLSAPFWPAQPQHTSSGFHTVFSYTNSLGKQIGTRIVEKTINSYGPTYAEVEMQFKSHEENILATYTHMEMPQTDENRGYYVMEYEFLEDVTFENFRDAFNFYTVTDHDATGTFQKFGYLDENNQPSIASVNTSSSEPIIYVLGDQAPYFDYCQMENASGTGSSVPGWYGNTSFIIASSEIVIGGQTVTPKFVVREYKRQAALTLDLTKVDFKKGDKIIINAIITPWGSQESDYSGTNFAPDQNVRDLRENSALNPFKATAGENTSIIESAFMPKVKTTNGQSAEFTISGGENNVTIRAYGFDKLSVPVVYEKVNGVWVEYALSSADSKDPCGYGANYDGYSVYYDNDGTYSYSFVTSTTNGSPRTFRIVLKDSFTGWERIKVEDVLQDRLPVYADPMEIYNVAVNQASPKPYASSTFMYEDNVCFIRLAPNFDDKSESAVTVFTNDGTVGKTGQYFILKYRTNATENSYIEIFASTVNNSPKNGDNTTVLSKDNGLYIADGQWHLVIIDLSKCGGNTYKQESDESYVAKYLRIDTTNGHDSYTNTTDIYTDIAYVGLANSIGAALSIETELDTATFYNGSTKVYPTTLMGDVNGDRKVTNLDLLCIVKHMFNSDKYPLDERSTVAADISGDGNITNKDILSILKYIYAPNLYPLT